MFKKTLLIGSILLTISACTDNTESTVDTSKKDPEKTVNEEAKSVNKEMVSQNNEMKKLSSKYKEGTHYRKLENPIKLEGVEGDHIIEYFWLACPHCQNFEPIIQQVDKDLQDVQVIKRHAALGQRWAKDATLYYNFKDLGYDEHLYDLFMYYKEIGETEKRLPNLEDINKFLASKNINQKEFYENMRGKNIVNKIEKTINEMKSNKIMGVPAVVVNGKYLINNGELPSGTNYSEVVEFLTNLK
tara:strand:- start:17846 stop:18577 length:732 start_codon:yes stop_codon:yes gene_type:complete